MTAYAKTINRAVSTPDLAERKDEVGALLYVGFLLYLFKGRSPMVYLAAFFITSWVELVGTTAGTWAWA